MKTPLVFDIKRGSIDDGDGIRTVIFLKGCPLNCSWCHNPESVNPQVQYFFDGKLCINCGDHSEACPAGAFKRVGKEYGIQELLSVIAQDVTYYKVSGGGVTFSGGEPALYLEYIGRLANELARMGISCFLETSGYFDFTEFKKLVLPYLDGVLYDIKLFNTDEHIKHTGKDNKIIIENLKALSREKIKLIPRTPLVPGITDTESNLTYISNLLRELGLEDKHVKLRFNDAGARKREMLRQGLLRAP